MKYWKIQLFRVRLSYERGKAYATMSKVAIGNGGFTVAWLNLMVFQRGGRKQPKHAFPCFFLPCRWITLKLIQSSKALTITTHNTNQHCRVRFCAVVGQLLSKQLYKENSVPFEYFLRSPPTLSTSANEADHVHWCTYQKHWFLVVYRCLSLSLRYYSPNSGILWNQSARILQESKHLFLHWRSVIERVERMRTRPLPITEYYLTMVYQAPDHRGKSGDSQELDALKSQRRPLVRKKYDIARFDASSTSWF